MATLATITHELNLTDCMCPYGHSCGQSQHVCIVHLVIYLLPLLSRNSKLFHPDKPYNMSLWQFEVHRGLYRQ